MLKKFKLISLLAVALVLVPALTSCGGKKQGDVLSVVPADAPVILYGNCTETLQQLGIEKNKINDPMKSMLEEAGADISELEEKMPDVDMFTKDAVAFIDGHDFWIVAALDDAGKFKKFAEENDADITKEDGVEMLELKDAKAILKDDFIFFCMDMDKGEFVADADDVKKLLDLGDESFVKNEKTSGLAKKIIEDKPLFYGLVNLKKLKSIVDDSDYDQALAALGLVIEDVNYVSGQFRLTADGMEAEAMFLDSKLQPAKSNIPLGTIKASDLKYASVPDPVYCAGVALTSKTISAIFDFAAKFGAMDPEIHQILSGIDGTAGLVGSLNAGPNTLAMMLTCTDNESATTFGQMLAGTSRDMEAKTSGNVLRITEKNGPSATSAPSFASEIDGCVAGGVFDFTAFAKEAGLSGEDAKLGTLAVMLKSENGAPVLRAVWNVKDPIKTLLKIAENADRLDDATERFYESTTIMTKNSYNDYDTNVYYDEYAEYAVVDSVAY